MMRTYGRLNSDGCPKKCIYLQGKLVQRDSLQVRKEQQEKSKYGSRKVSFSSGTESAPGTHPNQERTISWSSQKNSITLDDYVNDEEADEVDTDTDSVDSYSDNDTFEADSNFGNFAKQKCFILFAAYYGLSTICWIPHR